MLKKGLDSCLYVFENSKSVKINNQKIDEFVHSLDSKKSIHWLESSPFGILNLNVEEIVNFLLVYHSIGFSYWGNPKWAIETENGTLDGAYAMMYVLIKEIKRNNKFLKSEYLKNISLEEISELLKGNIEIPLLRQRHENLLKVSKVVNQQMNGNFYKYIKNIYDDKKLFEIITSSFGDVFEDVEEYKGEKIYFYKLAQLLVSDILQIRQIKEEVKVDYTHLIGCADYKIPQVLRMLGMLEYNYELSNKVDNKVEIKEGSDFEIEIRANMIVALNVISKKVNGLCPIEINDLVWLKGQNKTSDIKPYHLTRTRYY